VSVFAYPATQPIRQTAASVFEHYPSTVTRWQRRGAQQAARLHEHWLVKLRLSHLQLNELVVRVRTLPERIFVWTAMDSLTKLLVSVHIGSRKKDDAMRLVHDVKTRLQPDCLPVFTSDGSSASLSNRQYSAVALRGRPLRGQSRNPKIPWLR